MATWVWIDRHGDPAEYISDPLRVGDEPGLLILHFEKPIDERQFVMSYEMPDGANGTIGSTRFKKVEEPVYIPDEPKRTYRLFQRNYPYYDNTYTLEIQSGYLAQEGLLKLTPQIVWESELHGEGRAITGAPINLTVQEGVPDIGNTINYSNYIALLSQIQWLEQHIPIHFLLNGDETIVTVNFPEIENDRDDTGGE